MADDDDRTVVGLQETLEPRHALQIQVVRRFVEKQYVRMGEQRLHECQSHLPTPRELVRVSPEVALLEPQPSQHRSGLCLDGVATHVLEAIADSTYSASNGA